MKKGNQVKAVQPINIESLEYNARKLRNERFRHGGGAMPCNLSEMIHNVQCSLGMLIEATRKVPISESEISNFAKRINTSMVVIGLKTDELLKSYEHTEGELDDVRKELLQIKYQAKEADVSHAIENKHKACNLSDAFGDAETREQLGNDLVILDGMSKQYPINEVLANEVHELVTKASMKKLVCKITWKASPALKKAIDGGAKVTEVDESGAEYMERISGGAYTLKCKPKIDVEYNKSVNYLANMFCNNPCNPISDIRERINEICKERLIGGDKQ